MIAPAACMGSLTVPISVQCSTRKKYRAQHPAIPGPPSATSTVDLLGQSQSRLEKLAPPLGTGARDPHIWLSSPRISFVACHTPRWATASSRSRHADAARRFRGAQPNGDKTACVHKRERAHTCHLSPTPSSPFNWKAGPPRPLPPTQQGPRCSAWRADAAGL